MTAVFTLRDRLGLVSVEPLDLAAHLDRLHRWVTHPRSVYWGLQDADLGAVRAEYERIGADPHHQAWLGRLDGTPLFLAETYDPAHSELAAHFPVQPGDVGMHVLVAPPDRPRSGTTTAVMRAVLSFIFADCRHHRVVVEPDIRNEPIAARNAEAGFVVDRPVQLAQKVARLSFCTRADFTASSLSTRAVAAADPPACAPPPRGES